MLRSPTSRAPRCIGSTLTSTSACPGFLEGTENPWTTVMPTLVGSGQYAARNGLELPEPLADGTNFKVELMHLDGLELLQAIGFDLS